LLQDFENDQRLVIGTRWLERDLFSEIVANEPQYKVIMRAVKEDEQGRPAEGGRLTYPRRFSQKVLDEIRQSVGEYMYQTLMMNNPIGGEAMIFHERDFNYYETPPSELWTTITVDPAASDERNSSSSDPDYNVVLVAGIDASTGYIYVLDYFRARCNPGRVIDEIFRLVNIYDPVKVGIESVSYQKTLKYWVTQRQLAEQRFFQIEEIPNSKMKKVHRIRGLQPLFENRRIFLKSWMVELKGELLAFDRGAHDDLADALAMQLETLRHIEVPKVLQTEYVADLNKGASLIQELRGRFSRPKKFPYDMGPAWERQDWTPRVGVN
jgi:predicted phage terminase large subunit-like protein